MQLLQAPGPDQLRRLEHILQSERIDRYMPAAGGDRQRAFGLYLWNCALCEAFLLPLHFAEISCRNAIHRALVSRCGPQWFESRTLANLLDDRRRAELVDAAGKELRQHGAAMTGHHVVSGLTFGFWEHLTTKRFERFLWAKGLSPAFPDAPAAKRREDLHGLLESVRRWRNRIAHHQAIFDKGPMRKHQDAIEIIGWSCAESGSWVASVSRVPLTISLRPGKRASPRR